MRTALHLISHAVLQLRDLPSAPQAVALPLPALRSGARLVLQRAYTRLSYSYPYAPTASATRLLSSGSLGATVAAADDGQVRLRLRLRLRLRVANPP